jgi:hypothetical protein
MIVLSPFTYQLIFKNINKMAMWKIHSLTITGYVTILGAAKLNWQVWNQEKNCTWK